MGFSNKKEDVIYMELTPYGRQLLSRGKLKPAYYSFFDDDILYDIQSVSTSDTSNYASGFLSESNGATKQRILSTTPYLKPQISYVGRDKNITSIQNYYLYQDLYKMESQEKLNFLNYPIGTSEAHSRNFTPYWDIKFLHGTASSTQTSPGVYNLNTKKYLDSSAILSSSLPFKNVPQISFNLDYEISIKNIYTDENDLDQLDYVSPNLQITNVSEDGSYVSLKESTLLMHVLEKNTFRAGEAFSVEVYKKEKIGVTRKSPFGQTDSVKYTPLKFSSDNFQFLDQIIVNDILLDIEDIGDDDEIMPEINPMDDPSYVEYYFDLRLDSEIPEDDICTGLQLLKREEVFIDMDLECLERDAISDIDIYATKVTEIEEC